MAHIRGDFRLIWFGEHLGDNASDLNVPWASFVGNQTSVRNFHIDNVPTGEAYLLVQTYDVHDSGHRIVINGVDLSGFDIPREAGGWQTWMDAINSSLLIQGNNTIQIRRNTASGDNFVVGNVAVHYREHED